jgi:hypothetical protein
LCAQRQDGNWPPAIGDAARGGHWTRRDGVHDPGHQRHGRNLSCDMAARFDALRDDHVHVGRCCPARVLDASHLAKHFYPGGVGPLHIGTRIAPEQAQHRDLLFEADGQEIIHGKVQEQVHPKRAVGELAHPADLVAESWRRAQLRLQDAEAAGVAYGRDEIRPADVGTHGRRDDRVRNAELAAKAGLHREIG